MIKFYLNENIDVEEQKASCGIVVANEAAYEFTERFIDQVLVVSVGG
jgi:hypothetical protein